MSIKESFEKTEKLYHFTTLEKALRIIDSNRLRFGRLSNMNDIHEADKIMFVDANGHPIDKFPSDVLDVLNNEVYSYRQISFTTDDEEDDKDGFDLHQMWGVYADKGEGMCLVFDRKELEKWIGTDVEHERISYDKDVKSYHISFSDNPTEIPNEVKKQVNEIFYHKRKEWEHEQEFRLLKKCPITTKEEYLWYGKALKFILLSSKLRNIDEVRYFKQIDDIKTKAKDVPILIYGNGLLDYALVDSDHKDIIWDSNNGYDILIPGINCNFILSQPF